jgi:hypothetical protein
MSAGSGSPAIFFAHFAESLCVLCGLRFFGGYARGQTLYRKGRKELRKVREENNPSNYGTHGHCGAAYQRVMPNSHLN